MAKIFSFCVLCYAVCGGGPFCRTDGRRREAAVGELWRRSETTSEGEKMQAKFSKKLEISLTFFFFPSHMSGKQFRLVGRPNEPDVTYCHIEVRYLYGFLNMLLAAFSTFDLLCRENGI